MLETALTRRSASVQTKITLKTLISAGLIALAVVLPQVVHIALGQPGGVQLLPMYLPVLIGGCLLGSRWAPAVGVLSPVVSFLITSLAERPVGVPGCHRGTARRQSGVPRLGRGLPKLCAVHGPDDPVADLGRLAGTGDPGSCGAAARYRAARPADKGKIR